MVGRNQHAILALRFQILVNWADNFFVDGFNGFSTDLSSRSDVETTDSGSNPGSGVLASCNEIESSEFEGRIQIYVNQNGAIHNDAAPF